METLTEQNRLKYTYSEKNTSYSVPLSVKKNRFIFKILSRISENFSTRFACYLFFRPKRILYKEFGLKIMLKAHEEIVTINNRKIHIYYWGPNTDKKVLFVHGWEGRATSSKYFLNTLLEQDYQVYSFDAPAHGKSEGKSTDLLEIINVEKYVLKRYGYFETNIAHSFGSITTLHALQTNQLPKKLILISSISDPYTAVKSFQNTFQLSDSIIERLIKKLIIDSTYP